jgi:uncharacterized protein
MIRRFAGILLTIVVVAMQSQAAEITLERPGGREFVRDNASMLNAQDKTDLVAICDKLLTDKATPILVITINSMQEHGGDGMRSSAMRNSMARSGIPGSCC